MAVRRDRSGRGLHLRARAVQGARSRSVTSASHRSSRRRQRPSSSVQVGQTGRRALGRLLRALLRTMPAWPDLQVRARLPARTLAAYGFGPASGPWGGMVADALPRPVRRPHARPGPARCARPAGRGRRRQPRRRLAERRPPAERAAREASVLIIGGGAKSIGLYAAGLSVAHGAGVVDYLDDDPTRRQIAESFGARALAMPASRRARPSRRYDVVVEASSRAAGLAPRDPLPCAEVASALRLATTSPPGHACRSCACTPPTPRSTSVFRMHARSCLTCSRSSSEPASPPNV